MGLIKASVSPPAIRAFSLLDIEKQGQAMLARAQQQAEQLLMEAQREGDDIRQQSRTEGYEQGKVEGLAKGYEDGKKNGHQQALNEHREKMGQVIKALSEALGQINAQRLDIESVALREVVELAVAIAKRVTKRQGLIDPEVLMGNLKEAMKLVVKATDVRIAINPEQRKTLEAELLNLKLQWPSLQHVELIDEPGVSPGGCHLFTLHGQVEAELDGQLNRVIEELLPKE